MDKELLLRRYKVLRKFLPELLFCQNERESNDMLTEYIRICALEDEHSNPSKNSMNRFLDFLRNSLNRSTRQDMSSEIRNVISYEKNLEHLEKFLLIKKN